MKESESRNPVTLEDLLRVKRSERPSTDFWPEFDRQLRRKQLAALVDSRPRWRAWLGTKTIARICMPLGATAALALAISSAKVWNRTSSVAAAPSAEAGEVAAVSAPAVEELPVQVVMASEPQDAAAPTIAADQPAPTEHLPQVVKVASPSREEAPPASRSIAASLAAAFASENSLPGLFDRFTNVISTEESTKLVEPLAQISTPRDSRRERLMAYFVEADPHAPASSGAVRSRDRITRRLSDEALYDSMSRLGLTGQSVSIKF